VTEPVPEKGLPGSWIVFEACPKCGATVPRVRYIDSRYSTPSPCPDPYTDDPHRNPHFHVNCWRCGFAWTADMKGARR
jgi:hypothetical protein